MNCQNSLKCARARLFEACDELSQLSMKCKNYRSLFVSFVYPQISHVIPICYQARTPLVVGTVLALRQFKSKIKCLMGGGGVAHFDG